MQRLLVPCFAVFLAPALVRAAPDPPQAAAASAVPRVAPASQPILAMRFPESGDPALPPDAPPLALTPPLVTRDGPAPGGPFAVSLALDVPVTVAGLIAAVVPTGLALTPPTESHVNALRADRVNRLDRGVIGNHSVAAAHASDGLLAASLTLPFAAIALDYLVSRPRDGLRGLGRDSLVLAETFAVTALATTMVKVAVRRPRPYAYDPGTPMSQRTGTEATLSFCSGHTAWAFAMATSYSYLYTLRHEGSPWVPVVWGGTHAVAAVTGVLRVLAGKHFWSDVMAGAAVGSATGLLIPWLHHRRARRGAHDRGILAGHDLRVLPEVHRDGGGVAALVTW